MTEWADSSHAYKAIWQSYSRRREVRQLLLSCTMKGTVFQGQNCSNKQHECGANVLWLVAFVSIIIQHITKNILIKRSCSYR